MSLGNKRGIFFLNPNQLENMSNGHNKQHSLQQQQQQKKIPMITW